MTFRHCPVHGLTAAEVCCCEQALVVSIQKPSREESVLADRILVLLRERDEALAQLQRVREILTGLVARIDAMREEIQ